MKRSAKSSGGRRSARKEKKRKERAERLRRARGAAREEGAHDEAFERIALDGALGPYSTYAEERVLWRLFRASTQRSRQSNEVGSDEPGWLAPRNALGHEEEAQELALRAFEAQEAGGYGDADRLARRALRLDPDCSDAILVRAATRGRDARETVSLFESALAAARRKLGESLLVKYRGHFWSIVVTRPYMRALRGLAEALQHDGREDESIAALEEMLALCPNDELGARHVLLGRYLARRQLDEAEALLARYGEDPFAGMLWGLILLALLRGDARAARRALTRARTANHHPERYLRHDTGLPASLPSHFEPGSIEEAQLAASFLVAAWERADGALDWLRAAPPYDPRPTRSVHSTRVDTSMLGSGAQYLRHASWVEEASHRFELRVALRAAALEPGGARESDVPCRRKPWRRACKTPLDLARSECGAELRWHCAACHDSGTIIGWERTFLAFPAARRSQSERGEPGVLSVELSAVAREALLESPYLYEASWALLESAAPVNGRCVLHGRAEELEPLLGCASTSLAYDPASFLAPAERDLRAVLGRKSPATELERASEILLHRSVEKRSLAPHAGGTWRLRIELCGVAPPIWRELSVPGGTKLAQLHLILQLAMGWSDLHPHEFCVTGERYADPLSHDLHRPHDERRATLARLGIGPGDTFDYRYDFGDGWTHRLTVLAVAPAPEGLPAIALHAGERAAPPESCGGPLGYEQRLAKGGAPFDPDAFDLPLRAQLVAALAARLWPPAPDAAGASN